MRSLRPCSPRLRARADMHRLDVEFRPAAFAELAAIFDYVLEISRSFEVARGFTLRIRERCERIGDAPYGGRPRDDLAPGLRTVPFERSAVIAYVVENGRVDHQYFLRWSGLRVAL